MIRGDTKQLKFKIKKDETYIVGSDYDEVEVQFNQQSFYQSIKKLLSKGEVEWVEGDENYFVCFLSQEDTFALNEGRVEMQVRLYVGGDCKGTLIRSIELGKVLSKEVLG